MFAVTFQILGLLFVLAVASRAWRQSVALPLGADATHYVTTRDGWRLALHRYHGGRGEPIVLFHGLGANAYIMDLGPGASLARYLRGRGYDVWVPDLRGVGYSRPRSLRSLPRMRWTVDDLAVQDVPAIIDQIVEVTGQSRVHWVGHSLGGVLGYVHLVQRAHARVETRVASLCTLGAPGVYGVPGGAARLHPMFWILSWLPDPLLIWLAGLWIPAYAPWFRAYPTHTAARVRTAVARRALASMVSPVNPGVVRQVARWFRTGEFRSSDGSIDYAEGLERLRVPTLVIAGAADVLAREPQVRAGFERLGAELKSYHRVSQADGAHFDYAHGDLVIADDADVDVFPIIAGWMARQATRRVGAPGATQKMQARPASRFDPYARRLRERYRRRRAAPAKSEETPASSR